jgi:hypothetical protein
VNPIIGTDGSLLAFELTESERDTFVFGCDLMKQAVDNTMNSQPEQRENLKLLDGLVAFEEIRNDVAEGERFLTQIGEWYLAHCVLKRTILYHEWSLSPGQNYKRNCHYAGLKPVELISHWIDANKMVRQLEEHGISEDFV